MLKPAIACQNRHILRPETTWPGQMLSGDGPHDGKRAITRTGVALGFGPIAGKARALSVFDQGLSVGKDIACRRPAIGQEMRGLIRLHVARRGKNGQIAKGFGGGKNIGHADLMIRGVSKR